MFIIISLTPDQFITVAGHGWGDGSAVRCAGGVAGAYIGVSAEL